MQNYEQYGTYKKPSWAPPSWLFAPVWTVLYAIIGLSFGHVGYKFFMGQVPFLVLLPFALNLVFNLAFTPIQFGLKNFALGVVDILLVWLTLIWALWAIYPIAPWVAYINAPYLAWVSFATVLELTVFSLNRKSR
jgi:benzodiazapine receptor